jgi:hypothetical protein
MTTDKNVDVVKMIRKIRKRHYEETKHMSLGERMEHDRKEVENFKKELAAVKPDYDRFSFLHKSRETTLEK